MAKSKKIHLEQIEPSRGNSFTIRKFERQFSRNRSIWHAHPEYEIVYISNGKGRRHISRSVTRYKDGDLIFVGPNLPHFGFSEHIMEHHIEVVIQMKSDFLGPKFLAKSEMEQIAKLFTRAKNGLAFTGSFKHEIGARMIAMLDMPPMQRLLELLSILDQMATAPDFISLNAEAMTYEVDGLDLERLKSIYEFVQIRYQEPIKLEEVAGRLAMTVPAFCRYFKKITRKTFTQFLNEYRVNMACRLLENEAQTIAAVAHDTGFSNLSNFNKQFKSIMNETPSEYRKRQTQLVGLD